YTATFTPTADIEDTSNVVSVNMTGVTDTSSTAAGVETASAHDCTPVTREPRMPSTAGQSALIAGDSTVVTFTFGEAVSGFSLADVSAPYGSFHPHPHSFPTRRSSDLYTATFTPTADIEDTSNVVSVNMTGVTDTSSTAAGV